MKKLMIVLMSVAFSGFTHSKPLDPQQQLDALLQKVQQGYQRDISLDQARINTFTQRKEQQEQAVDNAAEELSHHQQKSADLHQQIELNQLEITTLTKKLNREKADLEELFKSFNSAAHELSQQTNNSMVTAQFNQQKKGIIPLLTPDHQPDYADINNLWSYYLLHMVESAKIATFKTNLVLPNGDIKATDITRLGTFTAFTEQGYARYLTDSAAFMLLPRQPQGEVQDHIQQFFATPVGLTTVTVDPSRGALIAVAAEQPDSFQRIQQAGIVGGLILIVGLVGIVIAISRGVTLLRLNKDIQQQRLNLTEPGDNPLGRILTVGRQVNTSPEQMNRLLDEAILGEIPALKKGLSTLAVLAGIAPLLGLLGTVAGMIETFQAITAFGNANPKILSSGISQALLTTEFGLVVAVPLALIHSYLNSRSTSLIHILEHQGAGLLTLCELDENNAA